jgi:hypothetical protein
MYLLLKIINFLVGNFIATLQCFKHNLLIKKNQKMKKVIFSLAILVASTTINAQDFKQSAGMKNLELQFTPLGGTPLGISGLRFRYFSSNTTAIRGNVFLGYSRTSEITQDANSDADEKELKTTESSFEFNLRPGFESHFEGTDRLSPYLGAELDLNFKTTSKTVQDQDEDDDIFEIETSNEGGAFRFGINGVAGFDYYFAKHLYFGAELGFGFGLTSPFAKKVTVDGDSNESSIDKVTTFNIGPNVNSAIRIGFLF